MEDCVFCSIVNKTLEKELLYEDDKVVVFKDILPKAPVHLLIVSKDHILSINHIADTQEGLAGHMVNVARKMALKYGVYESGYRLIFNVGRDGGQVIPHLHLHLLGGKALEA